MRISDWSSDVCSSDLRITQRLILQPRAELSFAAQDIPERRTGAGITAVETGLRLRYEFAREFAPYIGVGYETKLGGTADFARAAGEDNRRFSLLLGLGAWFWLPTITRLAKKPYPHPRSGSLLSRSPAC